MIYETTRKPAFDDTIIRGVDAIVNGLYYSKTETYEAHLPPLAYLNEFKSAFLMLPRQTGKTTYIKKLYCHLQDMGHRPVIVTRRKVDAERNFGRNFETKTTYELKDIRTILGKQYYYDVILFDEVPPQEAKEVLGLITSYQNRFCSKINFVLGLYT